MNRQPELPPYAYAPSTVEEAQAWAAEVEKEYTKGEFVEWESFRRNPDHLRRRLE